MAVEASEAIEGQEDNDDGENDLMSYTESTKDVLMAQDSNDIASLLGHSKILAIELAESGNNEKTNTKALWEDTAVVAARRDVWFTGRRLMTQYSMEPVYVSEALCRIIDSNQESVSELLLVW